MPRLEQIRDLDTLQQAAILLEKTVISQQHTIAKLKVEIAQLRGDTVPAQLELDLLTEQLEALRKKVFAPSSEKRTGSDDDGMTPQAAAPRRGHGPKAQPLLPVATQMHTLGEQERICPVCQGHLEPSWRALCGKVLGSDVVFMDETHWRLMDADGSHRWWTWCAASDDAAAYWIRGQHSREAAEHVLGDFKGILMSDGYAVYEALARGAPGITPVHCWAHVRRKFLEAESSFPEECRRAIELIGALYAVEREVPQLPRTAPAQAKAEALALRAKLRKDRSRPIIDELRDWAYATKPETLPASPLGKAIDYMLSLWSGLTRFLSDPRIPLDNNHAERALRGVVVGRKNHYGSHSRRGAEVAAILYTLFESAKLAGVNPHRYVLEATRRAIAAPGTATLPEDLT